VILLWYWYGICTVVVGIVDTSMFVILVWFVVLEWFWYRYGMVVDVGIRMFVGMVIMVVSI
jgi:hypothetical protein